MTTYRLIFTKEPDDGTARSLSFTANDASEALLVAQRHESPAQLWIGDQQLCTLSRSGTSGAFWIIS